MPCLELTPAVVSVKTVAQLQRELDLKEVEETFWTDSKVVLGYIANEKRRFHIFIGNRVQQIQEHSCPTQWGYVNTKSNLADHASLGPNSQELQKSSWIAGPPFLWEDKSCWPAQSSSEAKETFTLSDDDPEVKKGVTLVTNTDESFTNITSHLEYFSDYHQAKKTVALCFLYIGKLKERLRSKKPRNPEDPSLKAIPVSNSQVASMKQATSQSQSITVATMKQAELVILRALQAIHFDEEIEQDLHCVAKWCCENHLLINPDKTKLLFLGTRQMLSRLQEVPRVTFLGKILKPTVSAKDLGVLLDPNLTFDYHISTVVSSCLSKLCQINRVKKSFDKTTLELLITALVFSKMLGE